MSPSSLNTEAEQQTTEVAHVVDYDAAPGETPECIDDCPGCEAAQEAPQYTAEEAAALLRPSAAWLRSRGGAA